MQDNRVSQVTLHAVAAPGARTAVCSLPLPPEARASLAALTPEHYVGLAAALAKRIT